MSPQKKLVTAIGRDIHNPHALYAALSKEAPR